MVSPVPVRQMLAWNKSVELLTNKSITFTQTHRAVVNYCLSLLENTMPENDCHITEVLSNVLDAEP